MRRGEIAAQGFGDKEKSLVVNAAETLFNFLVVPSVHFGHMQTIDADFKTADGFQNRALKTAVKAHDFARRLHLRAKRRVGINKFIERPARELDDDIINTRLKTSLSLFGDGVDNFVKVVADSDFDADFGNGIARRLRRQRGTATDARIDFDNVIAVAHRVKRELNIATALNLQRANNLQTRRAQELIFMIVKRLCRGDND